MPIIDTHQHLWDVDRFAYSWCASVPALNRSFLPADYAASTAETDIVASVFVEADVDRPHALDETAWISELAAAPGSPIAAIVAAARPEEDDFEQRLSALQKFPLVRGVRRVLHAAPDELAQTPVFAQNLQKLARFGYSYDLCVSAAQLPIARKLIQDCPDTQFILDHCGNPRPFEALHQWKAELAEIALLPNVVCKLSGVVVNCLPQDWSVEVLKKPVDHVFKVFGPDRILWGSDWPVCTLAAGLKTWLDAAQHLTADLDEAERSKIFYENARRVYRLTL